jgi:hypothetical protein
MATEIITDRTPSYIHNKHTIYENTVLQEHSAITRDCEGKTIANTVLEVRARLFIGICLTNKAEKFIEDNWQEIYDKEYRNLEKTNYNKEERERAAIAGMWTELMNRATTYFVKRYKVDGTKAKIVAIDRHLPNGEELIDITDVDFLPLEDFNRPGYLENHPKTHPVWSYAQYIARLITGPKNIDRKIFVVGDSGDGKSMTGLCLAIRIAYWVSYYQNLKLIKQNLPPTAKPEDYFTFDKDHVACINTDDLLHVATNRLPQYSVKILDDCGAALGFTNRRSMTTENLDMVSIIGTNRVQNGVTIYCVHTEDFTDVRMRMLANDKIDLTDYIQSKGGYRIANLYKIKRGKNHKNKISECKFAFYSYGEYCTVEGIVCFMPEQKIVDEYNTLRLAKEKENTDGINLKYKQYKQEIEMKEEKPRCPYCNSTQLYNKKDGTILCRGCGKRI